MANLNFHRLQSRVRELKHLNAEVTIGATGAPTLVAAKSNGVASIARNDVGDYTVTLTDKYYQLVDFQVTLIDDTLAHSRVQVTAEDVDGAKTIDFTHVAPTDASTTTAAATEIASGATLLINIWVKNSTVR